MSAGLSAYSSVELSQLLSLYPVFAKCVSRRRACEILTASQSLSHTEDTTMQNFTHKGAQWPEVCCSLPHLQEWYGVSIHLHVYLIS